VDNIGRQTGTFELMIAKMERGMLACFTRWFCNKITETKPPLNAANQIRKQNEKSVPMGQRRCAGCNSWFPGPNTGPYQWFDHHHDAHGFGRPVSSD
jgi:hypothetical protein